MKDYKTPFVALVGPASSSIQGSGGGDGDVGFLIESLLPSNLEED